MHEHEARLERLEAERRDAPRAGRKLAIPTARARRDRTLAQRRDRRSGSRTWPSATCPAVAPWRRTGRLPGSPGSWRAVPFLAAQRGERIGIVGPNGAGKTTLLRTIAGDLPPLDGAITFGNAVQLGYLAQLRGAAIAGTTVLDALTDTIPLTAGEARTYLARFLFRGDDAFKEVRSLSGGERSRLELALLGIQPSNLLLLDEPTNHLDIPAREAIEAFMAHSPATLLVVSHDRRLLETVCEKLWVVDHSSAVAVRRRVQGVADRRRGWLDRGRSTGDGGGSAAGGRRPVGRALRPPSGAAP